MKKTIIILLIIISQIGLFTSCSDDEKDNLAVTNQESIGQSFKTVVDELKPTSAFVYESKLNQVTKVNEWVLLDYRSAEFKIEGSIIKVGNNYYNLNYLQKFNLYNEYTLNLYFKID